MLISKVIAFMGPNLGGALLGIGLMAGGLSVSVAGRVTLPAGTAAVDNVRWVEGELLVQFRHDDRRPRRDAALAVKAPVEQRILRSASRLCRRPVTLIREPDRTTAAMLKDYSRRPGVEAVSRNYLRTVQRSWLPNAIRFGQQWSLLNTGQTVNGVAGIAGADIGATRAWPLGRDVTQSVVVAVIDTGVDYRHPDLAEAMWVNPTEQGGAGIDNDGNGYNNDVYGYDFSGSVFPLNQFNRPPGPDPMDVDGHGTHVAGIAAATINAAGGVAGVAPARIMALKTSPDGRSIPLSHSLEAMAYAVMMKRDYGVPIAVINASFGGVGGSNALERDMIIEAAAQGIVVCAAAGNDAADNDSRHFYPAGYRLDNVLAVTASTPDDTLAAFGNYGRNSVDLAAPGAQIISSIPLWWHTQASLATTDGAEWNPDGMEFSGFTQSLTARLMDCGIGQPDQFPDRIRGQIALMERGGGLYFHQKVRHAMDAGAIAAIIYNHQAGSFSGTLVGPADWIPALALSRAEGQALLVATVPKFTIVTLSHTPIETAAYASFNGSSMATAFASGAIAWMAYQFPQDTAAERIARLTETVEKLPEFDVKLLTGGRLSLYRATDRDADGLPDWWEIDWTGSLDIMHATSDSSGNGMPDWQAYQAGIDPLDPAAGLRLLSIVGLSGGSRRLSWLSAAKRAYRIQYGSSAGQFETLSDSLPATPPVNVWIDARQPTSSPSLYRVLLEERLFRNWP